MWCDRERITGLGVKKKGILKYFRYYLEPVLILILINYLLSTLKISEKSVHRLRRDNGTNKLSFTLIISYVL